MCRSFFRFFFLFCFASLLSFCFREFCCLKLIIICCFITNDDFKRRLHCNYFKNFIFFLLENVNEHLKNTHLRLISDILSNFKVIEHISDRAPCAPQIPKISKSFFSVWHFYNNDDNSKTI